VYHAIVSLIELIVHHCITVNNTCTPGNGDSPESPAIPATRTSRLDRAVAKHYLVFLAMTFLVYSTVSTAVFQTFACDRTDEDINTAVRTRYLRADYSVQRDTSEHKLFKVYAAVMIIIYPLGIPALYAWLLWSNRQKICVLNRHDDASLRPTRFLWAPYTSRMYYWEVVECMRRLLLTGAIVFIAPGTRAQAAVACILSMVSLTVALRCRPHADCSDGRIYTVGAMIIFLSMFLSLAMKTDGSSETNASQQAFAVVLVVLNVVMAVAAVVQMLLVAHRARALIASNSKPEGTAAVDTTSSDNAQSSSDSEQPHTDHAVVDEQQQSSVVAQPEVRF
jgi:hypothetical protein